MSTTLSPPQLSVALPSVRRGRELVLLADLEAHETGSTVVDVEHLLLAAVVLAHGMPHFRPVLDRFGVTPSAVRARITVPVTARHACPAEHDRITCTVAVERLLARATVLASPIDRVRPVHLLLAVLDGDSGAALRARSALPVEHRRFRRALRRAARRAGHTSR
ncbi:Clp protease N-terminal domain-containing protein [Curtobacterium luteum]|uniref:Clp protease N-terminal domain-containing protein n=1 Tax=Curtobacterium luteum TaxID=33881 RepID=UPI00382A2DE1